MENFQQIIDEFRARDGVRQIAAGEADRSAQVQELSHAFIELLRDAEARAELGRRAYSVFDNNRGAAQRTIQMITRIYQEVRKS